MTAEENRHVHFELASRFLPSHCVGCNICARVVVSSQTAVFLWLDKKKESGVSIPRPRTWLSQSTTARPAVPNGGDFLLYRLDTQHLGRVWLSHFSNGTAQAPWFAEAYDATGGPHKTLLLVWGN